MRTLALTALLASAALAGPLSPPPGPVGPTMKQLTEVEPRTAINAANTPPGANSLYKITQPGSYYLTGNLTGAPSKVGIEIASPNVTIDLGGFTISGVAGSLDGIRVSAAGCDNTVIRNGNVVGFGQIGVDMVYGGVPKGGALENVNSAGNGAAGFMGAEAMIVRGCTATGNGNDGFYLRYGSVVVNCTSRGNADVGIYAAGGASFTGCTATSNAGDGFFAGPGSTVTSCAAQQNGVHGFEVAVGTTISGCTAQYNALDGIQAASYCTVSGNTCDSNGFTGVGAGVHIVGSRSRVEGNSCNNADVGIDTDNAGTIVVGNTCAGNTTNWTLAVGTLYGPIIDRTGLASAAVTGNSAPSVLATTDPNANFTH